MLSHGLLQHGGRDGLILETHFVRVEGSPRAACWSWFFSSILCIPGVEVRSLELVPSALTH